MAKEEIPKENLQVKEKKKPSIIFFFIKLTIIFLIFDFINPYLYSTLGRAVIYGRYSNEIIMEAVCFCIIIVVTLLAGNRYVFTQRKKNFLASLGVGGGMFGISIFLFLANSSNIAKSNFNDILSLAIFCILIGLFEEFMCRGWIQNELTERYSKNRNQAILSIALSSLIFGGMHISNIWIGGQGVIKTIAQIIQATGMGIYLGAIYYRTKNIWCNVFLHGFWDFSILLGEITIIKSCSEGNATNKYIIGLLISSIILFIIYTLLGLYVLRKSKITNLYEFTDEEIALSEKRKGRIIFLIFVLVLCMGYFSETNENEVCYTYEEKEVIYTESVVPKYNEYYFNDNNVRFKLYLKDNNLYLKDLDSEYEQKANLKYVQKFIVVNNNDKYYVIVNTLNKYQTDTALYYSSYFTTDNIINENYYIDNFANSFYEIESAPTIKELGYFYSIKDNNTYPYMLSTKNEKLLIEDKKLYTIKENDYEEFIETTE